jgi:hypothetical protein
MLPPHLEDCPRCGHDLQSPASGISTREIFKLTGYILLIALVPFVLLIGVAVICVLSAR